MVNISPQAFVSDGAELADDVVVGPFAYIGPQVRIASGCVVGANASIDGQTRISAETHIFPLAAVGFSPDGQESPSQCVIGQASSIREHVTISGGRDRPTQIGQDNLIMIGSHVGGGAVLGDHGIFANCTNIGDFANVEHYVRTSAFTAIAPGVNVGAYTFISGYANVDRDAPPFAIVEGDPVHVRGLNTHNLKRCGFSDEDIAALKSAFRELFTGKDPGVSRDALRRLDKSDTANRYVRQLVQAIRKAKNTAGGKIASESRKHV